MIKHEFMNKNNILIIICTLYNLASELSKTQYRCPSPSEDKKGERNIICYFLAYTDSEMQYFGSNVPSYMSLLMKVLLYVFWSTFSL